MLDVATWAENQAAHGLDHNNLLVYVFGVIESYINAEIEDEKFADWYYHARMLWNTYLEAAGITRSSSEALKRAVEVVRVSSGQPGAPVEDAAAAPAEPPIG